MNKTVMTDTQIARVVVRLFAGMMALGAIACANSPTRPTAAPATSAASAWAAIAGDAATPVTLAQCLGGSRNTIGWLPPSTGVPTSYVIQAGSAPNRLDLANFDTNGTALTLVASNVGAGLYFVRVYSRSSSCAPPPFLGPSSNEILLIIGAAASGWAGPIVCRIGITGPNGYHHDETQTWIIGGPAQTVGSKTNYPAQWSAQGSGGATGKSWTINSTATTDFSVTIVASTGIPIFDRTTTGIIIRDGIVGTPTSFDLYEIDFPTIVAGSANATSVSGTWSRATAGGDSPQQPFGSTGTLSCAWSLTFR